MGTNRGKEFEKVVRECFEKVPWVSIDRVHDQTTRYKGSTNICDYIVYREPYEFYIECKSVKGNTLSIHSVPKMGKDGKLHGFYGNISDAQWEGLLEKSKIKGVYAGILCWWIDKGVTRFIPIQSLRDVREYCGVKSIRYDGTAPVTNCESVRYSNYQLIAKLKRIYYDYDMEDLLNEIPKERN